MLVAHDIEKTYGKGHTALTVLSDLKFEYQPGELIGVVGASGSGKSTFLHIVGGLDRPTKGTVVYDRDDLYRLPEPRLADYRNRTIGFVFQFYHLLSEFTALENIMIPCLIAGISKSEALKKAGASLEKVGLASRAKHRPSELSGGEQQRVAIARAVVMQPKLLLADEPTGNLDKKTGIEIMDLILLLNNDEGMGIIMVTHDASIASRMGRQLELIDGKLQ